MALARLASALLAWKVSGERRTSSSSARLHRAGLRRAIHGPAAPQFVSGFYGDHLYFYDGLVWRAAEPLRTAEMRDRVLCEAECGRSIRVRATPTSRSLRRARGARHLRRPTRGTTGGDCTRRCSTACLVLLLSSALAPFLGNLTMAAWMRGKGGTEWRWPASRLRRSRTAHPQGLLAVRGGGGVSLRILQLSRSAAVQTMWPGEANSTEDRYARVEDATRERRWSCWTRRDAPAPRPWRLGPPPTTGTYPPTASPTSSSISAAAGPRRAAAAARSTWG